MEDTTNTTSGEQIQFATQLWLNGDEYLGVIARQFGSSIEAIQRINGGLDARELTRGRMIFVPGKLKFAETGPGHISPLTHRMKPIYRKRTEFEMENDETITTEKKAPAEKTKTHTSETAWTRWNERNKTADIKRQIEKTRRELDDSKFSTRVYDCLKTATDEITALKAERDSIIARQKAGELGSAYDQQIMNLNIAITERAKQAKADADRLVDEFTEALRASQTINPAHLTADAQFFQMGITLTKEDLVAMLTRNEGNPTMQRLIIDYSDKNKIELPPECRYDLDLKSRIESANAVRTINETYCARWITGSDSLTMLNRFFNLS